jgi:hypothetical protein
VQNAQMPRFTTKFFSRDSGFLLQTQARGAILAVAYNQRRVCKDRANRSFALSGDEGFAGVLCDPRLDKG